eukprot:6192472-Pleurochrysis_carterae.AAC.4
MLAHPLLPRRLALADQQGNHGPHLPTQGEACEVQARAAADRHERQGAPALRLARTRASRRHDACALVRCVFREQAAGQSVPRQAQKRGGTHLGAHSRAARCQVSRSSAEHEQKRARTRGRAPSSCGGCILEWHRKACARACALDCASARGREGRTEADAPSHASGRAAVRVHPIA